ncbi:MAG TPA: hypothetical protein VIT20_05490 [Propionibacteriaceae bacterium]
MDLSWHQALAYALTGRRVEELGRQAKPDVPALVLALGDIATPAELLQSAYAVPADLMEGIGAAQFAAALFTVRSTVAAQPGVRPAPVVSSRALTADERRLLGEVPPHHGV